MLLDGPRDSVGPMAPARWVSLSAERAGWGGCSMGVASRGRSRAGVVARWASFRAEGAGPGRLLDGCRSARRERAGGGCSMGVAQRGKKRAEGGCSMGVAQRGESALSEASHPAGDHPATANLRYPGAAIWS